MGGTEVPFRMVLFSAIPEAVVSDPIYDESMGRRLDEVGARTSRACPLACAALLLQDALNPPDWYPDEHPPMPAIVAHGSRPQGKGPPRLPSALCHLPNGAGHVESASLAALPARSRPEVERPPWTSVFLCGRGQHQ